MWDFFGIIIEQLSETFKWFLTGYFGTLALLIILYKNNVLINSAFIGFIKKVSYYIFLPIYIALICWFLSATIIVEKDAKKMAEYSLSKAEDSTFTKFLKEAVTYSADWVEGEITSKEELIDVYLKKNGYERESYSTKIVEWTLNNGLQYIENKAIENGTIEIGEESINFPLLIQQYINDSNGVISGPFSYLKGMTFKAIHGYAKKLYWIYGFLFLIPFLILGMDIYLQLTRKKKLIDIPFNQKNKLVNTQSELPNWQKLIDKE